MTPVNPNQIMEVVTVGTQMREEVEWLSPMEFLKRHKGQFGRNTLYNWLAEGKVPHVRINRKVLIPSDAFRRLLEDQAGD